MGSEMCIRDRFSVRQGRLSVRWEEREARKIEIRTHVHAHIDLFCFVCCTVCCFVLSTRPTVPQRTLTNDQWYQHRRQMTNSTHNMPSTHCRLNIADKRLVVSTSLAHANACPHTVDERMSTNDQRYTRMHTHTRTHTHTHLYLSLIHI